MSILANKAMWLAVLAVLCVGLAIGAVFGSTIKDADAAKRHQLKTLWAQVRVDGTVDSYKGLTGNRRLAAGYYEIDFNRDISKCAYTATLSHGYDTDISTDSNSAEPQTVYVSTSGGSGDASFHLVVNC